eukprot:scaffold1594_cov401-Prasinococcus_capsulatus_cf.AAC.51
MFSLFEVETATATALRCWKVTKPPKAQPHALSSLACTAAYTWLIVSSKVSSTPSLVVATKSGVAVAGDIIPAAGERIVVPCTVE